MDWYVDGHYIFAESAQDALSEASSLYDYPARVVREWTPSDDAANYFGMEA